MYPQWLNALTKYVYFVRAGFGLLQNEKLKKLGEQDAVIILKQIYTDNHLRFGKDCTSKPECLVK